MAVSMFWTAFTWGLGASLGASFGLMCYVVMKRLWDWATNTKATKRVAEINELSLAALDRRNDLTELQIEKLDNICVSMEYANQER